MLPTGGLLHLLHIRGGLHRGDDPQHPPLSPGYGRPPQLHICFLYCEKLIAEDRRTFSAFGSFSP